jgi:predicted TIM-barrel fold metal-dependent hydrolase
VETTIHNDLIQSMEAMDIIDAHEHLLPESGRVNLPVDVFTLFSQYSQLDLKAAGMAADEVDSLFDREIPLEIRWRKFAPYWEKIRHGSYARAARLAAEEFFNVPDINEDTYQIITEKIQEHNQAGLYQKVLVEACNIRTAITQCYTTEVDTPLLTPVMPLLYALESWADVFQPSFAPDQPIHSIDDFLESFHQYVIRVKAEGAVGLKMASNPYNPPDRSQADEAFQYLKKHPSARLPKHNPLRDYLIDQAISLGTEEGLVIAVHTGYWDDFREMDPLHMIPVLQRHPETRFDIYHLGYPWVRPALMLGKNFPNVWTNFCWTHIISQRFARAALEEAMDLIPINKILIFGGDYDKPVENVYGHLVMARENIAAVLGKKMDQGLLSESRAQEILQQWFWDNPKNLYQLDL